MSRSGKEPSLVFLRKKDRRPPIPIQSCDDPEAGAPAGAVAARDRVAPIQQIALVDLRVVVGCFPPQPALICRSVGCGRNPRAHPSPPRTWRARNVAACSAEAASAETAPGVTVILPRGKRLPLSSRRRTSTQPPPSMNWRSTHEGQTAPMICASANGPGAFTLSSTPQTGAMLFDHCHGP